MAGSSDSSEAAGTTSRRLFVYNGGFLTQRRLRRILTLSGYEIRLGRPGPGDMVGVWGHSPTARRGEAVARRASVPLLRVEDAFLRSLRPGRAGGEPPLGLLLDRKGVHFDPSRPSDLEELLATHPLDDTALLNRARHAIARIQAAGLSKYSGFDPALPVPAPGYVLVIDQTAGDASVAASGATAATFREMLAVARIENPGARILIKTHPETLSGHRAGHFTPADLRQGMEFLTDPVSPWALLEGAVAVYTVSSQLGFEAILAGHKPRVFGQPFYAGWGLTQDENPLPRRSRRLTRAQLFAAAMILAPTWYDPYDDRLCALEDVIETLAARARAAREDRAGYVAHGMRLWKRGALQGFFGGTRRVIFDERPVRAVARAAAKGRGVLVWAGRETEPLRRAAQAAGVPLFRVEDGFLRSRGLGAELVPPLSLVRDDLGIYYDPGRESRLERLIAESCALPPEEVERAGHLIERLAQAGLSKYNLAASPLPDLPQGRRILVPGQVEDDASVRLGCGAERTNLELLARARAENPGAVILYKPHPDVEAGLRPGRLSRDQALEHADRVLETADPAALIGAVDEVWTLTSLTGFEALIRGRAVTCLGAPFYAGWGLTRDLGPVPARRTARPSVAGLAHAALIGYPRYLDPVTGTPCPVEVIVQRLATGEVPRHGPVNRGLSRLQGVFAGFAPLWR
ncbi:capsular polysaccharide biosynthesis protein [Actibacterium sp. MT2.3-13A]|uniref:capsular polysaccharide biosynthesis protein n=1 Tax=Actibacterium sp. MT2.3-13A TaxID=2828332 RepID=UPI001BA8CE93|nr:capsular polysaccharide biosynthesis protein [Actibacterium sp. MT2.3-13A]